MAIYLTRLIDLDFKGWHTRSADTGGAEVDVIVEGARLIFSRWQIQAKNTKTVRLDDIAKEVGLSLTFVYSNVVMVVTTGDFTKDAYSYAQHVMKTWNLNVILLNGTELEHQPRPNTYRGCSQQQGRTGYASKRTRRLFCISVGEHL